MQGKFPRRFGKYVLLKSLAKGGMGEIYLAAGGDIGGFEKLCVIKKVLTEKADRAKANRFLDEAKVVLRLSHAALVTTFDAGEVEGEFYIAMELVEGKDLREVWNRCVRTRQRIPVDVALHVVREVARALAYVHAYADLKLVHRDVAPPNILLAYVGDVKLTDFGLARSVLKQEHTAPGVVFGRAAYLSPEQARGEVADARTDVYTLGIVLWELLTGQQYLTLAGLDPAAALAIVRQPRVVLPSTRASWIPRALDAVVMRALAPAREARFQTAEELRQALADVIPTVAPRADAGRVAEFLRRIYKDTIDDERTERETYLRDVIPQFRGDVAEEMAPPTPAPIAKPSAESLAPPAPPRPPVALPGLPGLPDSGATKRLPTPAGVSSPTMAAVPSGEVEPIGDGPIGGCELGPVLAEGRVGALYAGRRTESGQKVAVRLLEGGWAGPEIVERAGKRLQSLAALAHPHLATPSEVGRTDESRLFQILPPLEGSDVATVLRRERRLDAGRAVRIALQASRALSAAHEAGLFHLGLLPERLFLQVQRAPQEKGEREVVRVLDVGLTREALGGANDGYGDPAAAPYRAPEQTDGAPGDGRSDIYALGAILYEMVTGVPPHAGSEFTARKRTDPPQSPRMFRPEIPGALERVILSALEAEPDRRFPSMAVLERALQTVGLGLQATSELRPVASSDVPPAVRRRARREAAMKAIAELAEESQRSVSRATGADNPAPSPPAVPGRPTPAPPPGPRRPTPLTASPATSRPTPVPGQRRPRPPNGVREDTLPRIPMPPSVRPAPSQAPPNSPSAAGAGSAVPSAAPEPLRSEEPSRAVPTTALGWQAPSRVFGGSVLARYGASSRDRGPTSWVKRTVVIGIVLVVLAVAIRQLSRSDDTDVARPAQPAAAPKK